MPKSRTQVGSIHIVVVITFVLVIVGLLGWALYRSYGTVLSKTSGKSEVSRNESGGLDSLPDGYQRGSTTREFGAYLTFQYPKDWSVENVSEYDTNERTGKRTPSVQQTIVRSPSEKYEVVYDLLVDGIDSLCFKYPVLTIEKVSYQPLPGWHGVSFITTATAVEGNDNDVYFAEATLSQLSKTESEVAGRDLDTCKFHDGRVITLDEKKQLKLGKASIEISGVNTVGTDGIIEQVSLDAINTAFSSREYDIAKKILLTTKLE